MGGTIDGGTVTAVPGTPPMPINGTLSGVTLNADFVVGSGSDVNGSGLEVMNGRTLDGTLTVIGGNCITFTGTQTLSGDGRMVFADAPGNSILFYAGTLTIGPGITIQGSQSGSIWDGGWMRYSLVNQGTIEADASGATIAVSGSSVMNQGTMEAVNGGALSLTNWQNDGTISADRSTLTFGASRGTWQNSGLISTTDSTVNLGGTFTLADLGTFDHTGGAVNLTGTLDNTGTTLVLDSAWTSRWEAPSMEEPSRPPRGPRRSPSAASLTASLSTPTL